jgi:putative nucleotidyltransferase with HDIG domain
MGASAFLRTRVARRVVFLFVLSAVLPVATMASLSFAAVNRQLREQSEERLEQLAKNAGQSILQQFSLLESRLAPVAARAVDGTVDGVTANLLLPYVRALGVEGRDGTPRMVFGTGGDLPSLSDDGARFLEGGGLALAPVSDGREGLVAALKVDGPQGPATVWAWLRADSIWSPAETFVALPTLADFCVLLPGGAPLHCRSGGTDLSDAFPGPRDDSNLGTFSVDAAGGAIIAGYWVFHPAESFSTPPWTVLVAESLDTVYGPLEGFSTTFVMVLLLGLAVVLLFANTQVRRTMEPLVALGAGTQSVAQGDFGTRVEVNTQDEFRQLADSFNLMASRLSVQFTQLEAGRVIDRAVLGAFDRDEVVMAILTQVPQVVDARSAAVLFVKEDHLERADMRWRVSASSLGGTRVDLSMAEIDWLRAHPHHGTADRDGPAFFRMARTGLGPGVLNAFPFLVKGALSGALILESEGAMGDDQVLRARQMANLAAVALDDIRLVGELEDLSWGALRALARAIDAKSKWTAGHSERVTELAMRLGRDMNLDDRDMDILHRGGLLHDVGKIGVPSPVLDAQRPLTEDERLLVQNHPLIGVRILEPIEAFHAVLPLIEQHHERWDGTGYPAGRKGEEIHLLARILAVADTYDAIASARPYRAAIPPARTARFIAEESGTHFDPHVVQVLLAQLVAQGVITVEEMKAAHV